MTIVAVASTSLVTSTASQIAVPSSGLGFDAELWQRILTHSIGPAQAASQFGDRLARENAWSATFSARVLQEYRRFCYLAVTCTHPVTPSDAVDQAWHLHLTYTRDYWLHFCPNVLRTPLHHGPTMGGADEAGKYGLWYARTIASYEQIFGELPPLDIWPSAAERFADPARFQRIDVRARSTRRRTIVKWTAGAAVLAAGLLILPMHADAQSQSINIYNWDAASFLRFYGLGLFAMLIISVVLRIYLWICSPAAVATPALEPYEEAYLSGGQARVVDVAIVAMLQRGALKAETDGLRVKANAVGNDALERELLMQLRKQSVPSKMTALKSVSNSLFQSAEKSLIRKGLLMDAAQRWRLALLSGLPLLLWLALGLSRIVVGIQREKPVMFLVLLCLLTLAALALSSVRSPKRTRAGNTFLKSWTKVYARLARAPLPEEYARGVALFGIACLMFTPLSLYADWRRTPDGGGGDSGTSSSGGDSSGDGGSGCGGCGGD